MPDLSLREKIIFLPLIIVVFWMGIYPNSFLDPIHASVENLIETKFPVVAAEVVAEEATAATSH